MYFLTRGDKQEETEKRELSISKSVSLMTNMSFKHHGSVSVINIHRLGSEDFNVILILNVSC